MRRCMIPQPREGACHARPRRGIAVSFDLDDGTALVQTMDFFTPVVDDAYAYGQIAAANALSDVYAMGGKPLTAMNIACFDPTMAEPEANHV